MPKYKTVKEKIEGANKRLKESRRSCRYSEYKSSAKIRGFTFDLTKKEFLKAIKQKCYYCGLSGFGIDRVDSSMGYIKSNIVSSCSMCNYMKRSYSKEEFIKRCLLIAINFLKKKNC